MNRSTSRGSRIVRHCMRAVLFASLLPVSISGCDSSTEPAPVPVPFEVSSTGMVDVNKILVGFNKRVTAATAEADSSYVLEQVPSPSPSNSATAIQPVVHRADLQPGGLAVMLTTDELDPTQLYQLRINGVKSAVDDGLVNNVVRSVADNVKSGTIVTWAGVGRAGFDGDEHRLEDSWFYYVCDLEFTSSGCYILDWNNHNVRRVTPQNTLHTVIGTGFVGDGNTGLTDRTPPGVPGTTINLNHPTDIDELPDGRILLSAWHNHKLRIFDPVTDLAYVSAGEDPGFSGDGGQAKDAQFNQPTQSVVLGDGTIYVLDQRNQRIRKIDPSGITSTVAGTGVAGYGGDGGDPLDAMLNFPAGSNPPTSGAIAVDAQGRLYISDTANNRIRRVDFVANKIETVAGDGNKDYSGDGGSATSASLNNPRDIEIGPDGRLYICDEQNNRIRAVDLGTGIIQTVVGTGTAGFSGDGGAATKAMIYRPSGLAFDGDGYMYIADCFNHRIRRVVP